MLCLGFFAAAGQAAIISTGTALTTVPPDLDDPLPPPLTLGPGQFLLPIKITGAGGLQDWSFDLTFDGSVVTLVNLFDLYDSVYAAHFSAGDPTLIGITSGGLSLPG